MSKIIIYVNKNLYDEYNLFGNAAFLGILPIYYSLTELFS